MSFYRKIIKRIPAYQITKGFKAFIENKSTVGILLIISTFTALVIANTHLYHYYHKLLELPLPINLAFIQLNMNLEMWINDGLMAVFFLLVGMEIKRELMVGELSTFKKASLPIAAAIGGMIVPAVFYLLFNAGSATQSGWGIPMATDIAFAIGILSLSGKKVPVSLKVFLTALAVVDDLGAILVIALFYTSQLQLNFMLMGLGVFAIMLALNRMDINIMSIYILLGLIVWYCIFKSGVHATIAGVLVAFTIPYKKRLEKSLLHKLEHAIVNPVNFLIIPLFAFVNTGIHLDSNLSEIAATSIFSGISLGLILGKPIGIFGTSLLAVRSGIASLPVDIKARHLLGAGCLGGIGFTMSIFISMLAFNHPEHIDIAKISVLISSTIAGITGYLILKTAK